MIHGDVWSKVAAADPSGSEPRMRPNLSNFEAAMTRMERLCRLLAPVACVITTRVMAD